MTDSSTSPAQGAQHPEPPQASLRAELAGQIASAQSELQSQLAELQRASGDSSLTSELQGQLHVLGALGQFLSSADGSSLSQIRAELATSVAAVRSIAQQAQTAIAAAHVSEAAKQAAEYAAATVEIDRKVAPILAADRENSALAHAMANRFGIDLSGYDQERETLQRQQQEAAAHGDKVGQRQADVLVAENTYNSMAASADHIKDPAERRRYLQAMQEQQQNVEKLKAALAEQLELQAQNLAHDKGLSPAETTAFIAQYKAEGMSQAEARGHDLKGADQAQATQLRLEAEVKRVQAQEVKAAPALLQVDTTLTPEAKAQTQKAAAAITAGFDTFAASISLDGTPQIALSTTTDAHNKVEVPPVAKAIDGAAQGRA
ncbi:hypothetical protein [Asticcacaulis sp. 201]|uniref:hypothetical protein n=1 Tax=Asticcacaulis sp. 201 TaxID=3028787 RepID=UPI0029165C56|nr:hypothetical protein [Asticcacaulis sp. 201]MDV6333156.1 hypothetical protein [Asticcacaulis sp. 201]